MTIPLIHVHLKIAGDTQHATVRELTEFAGRPPYSMGNNFCWEFSDRVSADLFAVNAENSPGVVEKPIIT